MNSVSNCFRTLLWIMALVGMVGGCGPDDYKPELLPPSITTQPQSQSVEEGQAATFSVEAEGAEPLAYQWQSRQGGDWLDVEGATAPSYETPPATLASHGRQHRCVVTNPKGSATSDAATLTVVRLPPVITIQPEDQTVVQGAVASFSAEASGAGEVTLQWQLLEGTIWTDIAGATQGTYQTPPAALTDHGKQFRVVAINEGGSTSSDAATLTVLMAAPVITTHPANQSVVEGDTATFTVAATGAGTIFYQWQVLDSGTWTDIGDATAIQYVTHPVSLADDGTQVRCQVSNAAGSTPSGPATLSVAMALPVIVTHPSDQAVVEGEPATFSVTATGSGTLAYQWQRLNGGAWTDLGDATSMSYHIPGTSLSDDGLELRCRISNEAGSVFSAAASLGVAMALPVITNHPADQTVGEGGRATFTVTATGSGNLAYQWQWLDGAAWTDIADATGLEYQTPEATLADNGKLLRCQVSNEAGSVFSTTAYLFVDLLPPVITAHPTDQTVNEGQQASFLVAATGSGSLSYQWQWLDGAIWRDLTGAQGSTYLTPSTTLADDGKLLRCVVSNAAGSTP
ncbi:MAG: hypothetical protein RBU30_24930, partial [Polyangia bacterium]|nr:hypothetical protein [Polyangia bacterium]